MPASAHILLPACVMLGSGSSNAQASNQTVSVLCYAAQLRVCDWVALVL
jgi:hypothetical protein